MFLISYDPGHTTGVVAFRVGVNGIHHLRAVEILEHQPLPCRDMLTAEELDEHALVHVVLEAPPAVKPDSMVGVRRAEEIRTLAAGQFWEIHEYLPGHWKPSAKMWKNVLPEVLRSAHTRDAYGMALHHIRKHSLLSVQRMKEPRWHLPTE